MNPRHTRRHFLAAATGSAGSLAISCARSQERAKSPSGPGSSETWKAGVAKIQITPNKSLWMCGFAARGKPSNGTILDLNAKALALQDSSGKPAVLVTSDLIGFPGVVSSHIAEQAAQKYGIPRDRLIFNSSHTHSGPVLAHPLQITYKAMMSADQWRDVEDYTRELEGKVVAVIGAALKNLQPARLSLGRSQANFAVNRRKKTDKGFASSTVNPEGVVDHTVPVLRVESEQGQLRAVLFGYSCHNTTLTSTNLKFCGDYAGFAQQRLEKQHPEATALFLNGCGADANPNPRGTVELAQKYGEELAVAVDQALGGSMRPIRGPLKSATEVFPVQFAPPPGREELQQQTTDKNVLISRHAKAMLEILDRDGRLISAYPYTLEVWQLDHDLTLVAMAGEVVVDYAIRLKKELGADKVWVAGYSNDVFGYVPSLRILQEGGYEGGEAMRGGRLPGPFAPSIEETIVGKVHELVKRTGME